MITVTKVQLYKQLAQGSASHNEHLEWLDDSMQVLTEDGPRTAQSTVWFLSTGQWVDNLFTTCGEKGCLVLSHITDSKAQADAAQDARDLALVQRTAVTLADLYRRGKARGLLRPGSTYGG